MEPAPVQAAAARSACWRCLQTIDAPDKFCRHCGASQGEKIPWRYQPWGLALWVLILGPFALPMIQRSPALSRKAKTGASAAVLLVTLWVCLKVRKVYQDLSASMDDAINQVNQMR